MRIAARLTGVLLLTACLAACDTEEVLQLASQNATVSFRGLAVDANYFDIWQAYEDNDNNGVEDPGTTPFLWCVAVRDPTMGGIFLNTSVTSAPWQFSFRVSVLAADGTQFEPITDNMFFVTTANATPFDTRVIGPMTAPPPNAITVSGRTFKFRPYRNQRWTEFNAEVVANNSDVNVPAQLSPGTYTYGNGLCSTASSSTRMLALAGVTLAGGPPPFSFDLGKGESVRIEATKNATVLAGLTMTNPALTADMAIDGVSVNNFVVGNRGTGTQPGESLSFTYTSR